MNEKPLQNSPFVAPTAEQMQRHLDRYPTRGPSRLLAWGTLGVLVFLVVMSLTAQAAFSLLLWLALGVIIAGSAVRVRHMRRVDKQVTRAQELAIQRQHTQSLRLAWRTLASVTSLPVLHGRTVAVLAANLEAIKAFEPAIVAYDYLIDRLPSAHPGSVHMQIHRAIAQFDTEELTNADDALRRLRTAVEPLRQTPIGAAYRMAQLIQQVRTHHYADAVEDCGDLVADLRSLGIDAGFGYALMALSHHVVAEQVTGVAPDDAAQEAAGWWTRATLLLSPAALIERFPELDAIGLPVETSPFGAGPRPPVIGETL